MEYYSSIKTNVYSLYTWMTLENMLREKKLDREGCILYNSIYKISRKGKLVEIEVDQKLLRACSEKITCNPMFTGALFTIARAWKQPKCP